MYVFFVFNESATYEIYTYCTTLSLHDALPIFRGLEDRVLGRQIHRPLAREAIVEAGACEVADRIVEIVHAHRDARRGELEHLLVDPRAVLAFEHHAQLAGAGDAEVGRAILVAEGRSEERRVGQECVSTGRSRWSREP